jgi:TRAP-type C4-dicarboxylate transport system permease small subunit
MRTDVFGAQPMEKAVSAIQSGLTLLIAVALFAMMGLMFADVVFRYALNAPITGAYELTEFLMVFVVFGALPVITVRRGHVQVTALQEAVPALAPYLAWLRAAVTAAMLGFLAWHLGQLALQFAARGDTTLFGGIPLFPFVAFAAVLTGLSTIAGLIEPLAAEDATTALYRDAG